MNASDPIRRHAQLTPHAVAYQSASGATATYAVLEWSINAVAHRIRELGLVPGQTAAIASNDLWKYMVITLALGRLGIAHAPMTLPANLTAVALVDHDTQGNGCARVVSLNDLSPRQGEGATTPVASHADGAAILLQCPSSGTTGRPKFTPISHDLALRRANARALGLAKMAAHRGTAAARQSCHIGPGSSYGFSSVFIVLCGGGTVVESVTNVRDVPAWLVNSGVNYLVTSPILLQQIVESLPALRAPNSLDALEVGGGVLPPHVYAMARERLCANIVVNYGLTESGRVAWAPAATLQGHPGAVGHPYPGVEIEIVDDDDQPVAAGAEGVVRIRSEQNASSYLHDPEASAAVFRQGWVYPGDRGVMAPDGLMRITGRTDDFINRGGLKINPQEIEAIMIAMEGVRDVAVFGVVDGTGVTQICAAVVNAGPIDANAFHARCLERLGDLAPFLTMHVRELPRNANGKVVRHELVRAAVEAARKRQAAH